MNIGAWRSLVAHRNGVAVGRRFKSSRPDHAVHCTDF